MTDALELLISDHRAVEGLFAQLGSDGTPDPEVVRRIVRDLSTHDAIEKEHLYPVVRARLDDGNQIAHHSITEHGEVARLLAEIDRRPSDDPHRRELLAELMPTVRAHVAEEEAEIFPVLASRMAAEELAELGETLARAKEKAPTRPHPHAPSSGWGNRVARKLTAPLDKLRDLPRRR